MATRKSRARSAKKTHSTAKATPAAKKKSAGKAKRTAAAPTAGGRKRGGRSSSPKDEGAGRGGARSIWTGAIAFGLVQIPVRLLGAEKSNELSFHQLDRRDLSRIRYERINEDSGEKVEWADIIKGYELDDGTLVPLEEEDFEKANVEASHTIDIQDFVDRNSIPPAYFEKPYYLVPNRAAKPYAVLRDAMAKKGLVAIALVVIRTRQHLCAIVPEGDGLMLEILRFADELKQEAPEDLPKEGSATAKEIALAEQLIDSLAGEWDPSKYRDTFREEMIKAIETKAKTGKIPAPRKSKAAGGKVTDLVALLKKSLQAA